MGKWTFQPNLESNEPVLGVQMKKQYKEQAELFGYPIKYIRATETESNSIFQESTARDFIDENGFSFYCNKDEDSMYSGSELFGGFGYTPKYTNIFYIPSLFFEDEDFDPLEGDLIHDTTDDKLYQITKVDTLTETQLNLKINNTVFSRKVYLKQYEFSYKDSFDDTLEDDLLNEITNLEELDTLNETLQMNINTEDKLNSNDADSVFGDYG